MRPVDEYGSRYQRGFCEQYNEASGVMERKEFLDQLSECHLLRKDFSSMNYVTQRWVHKLSNLQKPPQNSKRQRDDWKLIPY
jgi:hypothetical protein